MPVLLSLGVTLNTIVNIDPLVRQVIARSSSAIDLTTVDWFALLHVVNAINVPVNSGLRRAACSILRRRAQRNARRIRQDALVAALLWDEDVKPPGEEEAEEDYRDDTVGYGKTKNLEGILHPRGEFGVSEREDDEQDRRRDVLEYRCPEEGDGPVVALRDCDVQITTELVSLLLCQHRGMREASEKPCPEHRTMTYRVEGQPPQLVEQRITAPEPGGRYRGCPRHEDTQQEGGNENTESRASASLGRHVMCDNQTQDKRQRVAAVEDGECRQAYLSRNIAETVNGSGHHRLEGDDAHQRQIADPGVNRVEQISAKYMSERRNETMMMTVETATRETRFEIPVSMTRVTSDSSMAKQELNPSTMIVMKKITAQKLLPGICTKAAGKVMKARLYVPSTSPLSGRIPR
ncbi:hypothetical protein PoMZ_07873 [Pyricularia oryzae]|uniref:Uncharacterized protein n=1 Tax=Pyricularia oryzae TaxID=318829 RepID=A0A4P7NG70_PYROR|nr:hypothetical protein PoMZ_07873 [Pyricularia oryzae]